MVDPKGIEPSTSRMRTVRSSQLSYGPKWQYFVMLWGLLSGAIALPTALQAQIGNFSRGKVVKTGIQF